MEIFQVLGKVQVVLVSVANLPLHGPHGSVQILVCCEPERDLIDRLEERNRVVLFVDNFEIVDAAEFFLQGVCALSQD